MPHDDDEEDLFDDLTPVQRRRLKSSIRINDTPAERIAYQHTVLCQTCLPYRDPGADVRRWQRSQGSARLEIEAGRALDPVSEEFVDVGLPFGPKPRLILAYLQHRSDPPADPLIEVGDSLTDFVKRIRSFEHGREIRAIRRPVATIQTDVRDLGEKWESAFEECRKTAPAEVSETSDSAWLRALPRVASPARDQSVAADA